jgi:hypothetical protein
MDARTAAKLRRQQFPLELVRRKCVQKLCDVATTIEHLKPIVLALFGRLASQSRDAVLASLAHEAMQIVLRNHHQPVRKQRPHWLPHLVAMLGAILPLGLAFYCGVHKSVIMALTHPMKSSAVLWAFLSAVLILLVVFLGTTLRRRVKMHALDYCSLVVLWGDACLGLAYLMLG